MWGGAAAPASAARPLLDKHQWDAYFALFARDVYVPWKATTVRLDTYSGAPVDFAAYNVDPAEVIVAGAGRSARALDTARRRPVVRWRYSPPPGYRFESNDVPVPLGNQEGFYVIEARRGDAVQQVWLNRTHVGLLTKESPDGLLVWGVDLRSGRAIGGMEVDFLVGLRLIAERTGSDGTIVWRDPARPSFALAASGAGRAFVSLLPQAPVSAAIVGIRLDSAVVRAGESVRFVGFARKRSGGHLRRAAGDARITLAGRGTTLASTTAHLDAAGAFSGELAVPAGTEAGDLAVLANAAGGVGGTSLHVDAVSDVALEIRPLCPCVPDLAVPFAVTARRGDLPAPDVPVYVTVIRTPHVVPPGAPDDAPRWGTTVVVARSARTDAQGVARVDIGAPSDGLDSTYGIRATTRGATATSRIVVPMAPISLAIEAAAPSADVGAPVAFDVRGFDPADGTPAADAAVLVTLSHGASEESQAATLDARGRAQVVFKDTSLGSNLALAETTLAGRRALDATSVLVEPSALSGQSPQAQSDVALSLDKVRYRPGDRLALDARAPGASGEALLSLEGARTYATRLAAVSNGEAAATVQLGDPQGDVRVSAAFVRDGSIATGDRAVALDAPGHARLTELSLDKPSYAAGETAHLTIRDGGPTQSGATLALRVADGRESGPALFDDAPDLLETGATSEQAPASADPEWHAYVQPARSKASDIFAAERPRKVASGLPSIGVAAPRTLLWQVARGDGATLDFAVPSERGHFVVSILKIADDGDVGAASLAFNVQ